MYPRGGLGHGSPAPAVHEGHVLFRVQDCDGAVRTAHVTVFLRPGLSEFLDRVSQFSELVLFTAGQEGYANPVIDRIDPQGRITHRLYRPATVST